VTWERIFQNPKNLPERKAFFQRIKPPESLSVVIAEKLLRIWQSVFFVGFILVFFAIGMYYYYNPEKSVSIDM
jgi:hypothetical protein